MKKLAFFVVLALVFNMSALLVPVDATDGKWIVKASLPNPLAAFGTAVVDGKIYVVGGECGDWGDTHWKNVTWEYDPQTNSWASRASMPTKRGQLAVASVDGKIYAIGGSASTSGGTYSTTEEFDPHLDVWGAKAPMPTPRNWIKAAVVDGKIYIIAGSNNAGGLFSNNEIYDPVTDTWSTGQPIPTLRHSYGIGVVYGKIYVIGGWNGSMSIAVNEEYDPVTNTWSTKTPMPTARNGLSVAVMNNRIYAIGGAINANPWTNNLNIVEEYDPSSDTWTMVESMPTARSLLSATSIENRIFALGGVVGSGVGVDTNEEFAWARSEIAVSDVTTSKTGCLPMPTVGQGYTMDIIVTVENQGDFTETFNVTTNANTAVVGSQSVTLNPGENATLIFVWDTAGSALGNYTISATADILPEEIYTADNTFIDGWIVVTRPGDINADGFVNGKDAVMLGVAHAIYNPNCDINNDGWINAKDAVQLGVNFDY